MGSKGDNTTTQKTAPDPAAMAAYRSLMDRAQGVANTPYQPYTGELTAGVNAQQNLGIGNLNNATQAGQPWFDYAASMAHPIATSDIQRYQNPYTQQVVDATQAQFNRQNAQQQEGLKANAISKGALGGSRADIAAADMAYQQQQGQAPVIAGLYNQSYNNALAAAQQQQQAGFQGAGVGANIQQAGLQGAGAQIGAGTLQQQTEQARLNAQYQQYQQAQAFPYQQTQWLAGIDTGVGSQMGGTSTTTGPAPSLLGQVAGLGMAGVGAIGGTGGFGSNGWLTNAFSARGGRINGYDAGGSVGSEPYSGVGFIPRMQIRGGPGAPHAPAPAQIPQQKFDPKNFAFPKSGVGADSWPGTSEAAPEGGMSAADAAAAAADPAAWYSSFLPEGLTAGMEGAGSSLMSGLGGVGSTLMSALPEGVAAALPFLLLNRGGGVRGYADGGPPSFDDRWNGVADDTAEPIAGVGAAPMPRANPFLGDNGPIDRSQLPRQFFDADDGPDGFPVADPPMPGNALGYAPSGVGGGYEDPALRPPAEVAGVGAPPAAPSRGGFDWSSLSMPLMAAGLGMMASRSPHLGVAIGEGGLHGVQAYAEQQKQTAERGLAEKKQALDARRLDQMAQQAREHLALQTRQQDSREKQADRPYKEMTVAEAARLGRERYSVLPGVTTADGHPVERDMQHPQQPLIDAVTRKPVTQEQMATMQSGKWVPYQDKVTEDNNPVQTNPTTGQLRDAVTKQIIPPDAKLHSAKEIQISGQSLAVRAHQKALGDVKGAYAGLPWGSGANIAKQKIDEMATSLLVNDGGMTPQQAAEHMSAQNQAFNANGIGLSAEARTAGTREANLNIILKATEGAIPAALEASREVTRYSGFVPLDKIIQKGQVAVNDPKMVQFGMANLQLAEHWARAMNPTGVMRESDRDMALSYLSTARNQPTYEAAVQQLKKQIDRELAAVKSVKSHGGAQAKVPGGDQAITSGEVKKELGAAAPAGPRKRTQKGHTFEEQPDGSWKAID